MVYFVMENRIPYFTHTVHLLLYIPLLDMLIAGLTKLKTHAVAGCNMVFIYCMSIA